MRCSGPAPSQTLWWATPYSGGIPKQMAMETIRSCGASKAGAPIPCTGGCGGAASHPRDKNGDANPTQTTSNGATVLWRGIARGSRRAFGWGIQMKRGSRRGPEWATNDFMRGNAAWNPNGHIPPALSESQRGCKKKGSTSAAAAGSPKWDRIKVAAYP